MMIGTRDPECYVMGNGEDYRGYQSVDEEGSTCLNWTITTSYNFIYNPMDYPDAGLGGHNYCRNPSEYRNKAWCYVNEYGGYSYCDIGCQNLQCTQGTLCTYDRRI